MTGIGSGRPLPDRPAWGPSRGRVGSAPPIASLPVMARLNARPGEVLPERVLYSIGGSWIPPMGNDPNLPKPVTVSVPREYGHKRLGNGLRPHTDAMVRYVLYGATVSDAFRAAYRTTGTPQQIARWGGSVARRERFQQALHRYREALREQGRATQYNLRDFVLSRLTIEAQDAENAGHRIKALELLGKTEGMFIDTKRTEKAIDPRQLEALKAQLSQRLTAALSALGVTVSHGKGTEHGARPAIEGEAVEAEPGMGGEPLNPRGDPSDSADTIQSTEGPKNSDTPEGWSEFEGPLVLGGGLRD